MRIELRDEILLEYNLDEDPWDTWVGFNSHPWIDTEYFVDVIRFAKGL